MTGQGRPAARPPAGWRPRPRQSGGLVLFTSEDGRQQREYCYAGLPGPPAVVEELVAAFVAATGPLGTWKRTGSANGLWTVVRKSSQWIAVNRPSLASLGELSTADMRMLLLSMRTPGGHLPVGPARALFGYSQAVSAEAKDELARHRSRNLQGTGTEQPYTAAELRWITIAARAIVRRARQRLDGDGPGSRYLSAGEAWAFAVLLAALTGLNPSVLFDLPAMHASAAGPGEPGIALVSAIKRRRGPRSAMTLPLTSMLATPQGASAGRQAAPVPATSLTTPFGVFTLLVRLAGPARRELGTSLAFAWCGHQDADGNPVLAAGPVKPDAERRRKWLAGVLTGDPERDEVLLGTSLRRLRKTYLAQSRQPVAHTPATLAGYLRKMTVIRQEGFQVVRKALDEQVQAALSRRQMTVEPSAGDTAASPGDTVLAECTDFGHSPMDGGGSCRQTFLSCLDCANARALPRHLPLQLVVLDELQGRQARVPVVQWATEVAPRVAQLEQVTGEFEPAQVTRARAQITSAHRHTARGLLSGDLDPI